MYATTVTGCLKKIFNFYWGYPGPVRLRPQIFLSAYPFGSLKATDLKSAHGFQRLVAFQISNKIICFSIFGLRGTNYTPGCASVLIWRLDPNRAQSIPAPSDNSHTPKLKIIILLETPCILGKPCLEMNTKWTSSFPQFFGSTNFSKHFLQQCVQWVAQLKHL